MLRRLAAVAVALAAGCGDGLLARPDDAGPTDGGDARADASPDARLFAPPPAVIVLIGDGMGRGQLEAASLFRHGVRDGLFLQRLPYRGDMRTASPSGITDSAAAATVMATGVFTYNGALGVDRRGQPVQTLVERASARGWATGVVTTTSLPHATPAGFTAHVGSRGALVEIADQMVGVTHPDVMLGGGSLFFAPTGEGSVRADDGLYDDLAIGGYTHVRTTAELVDAVARGAPRIFGDFAPDQMTFVAARPADTTEPRLLDMAAAALATLDRDPHGFFVMIEGGRIDHGGHANNLVDVVQETLAFDDTVAYATAWARARGNTTVLVTADHETGGLEVTGDAPAGEYPPVRWRWGNHSNARVIVAGDGPGTDVLHGAVVDHRWIHAIAKARMDHRALEPPPREPVPDGELADLRHQAVVQAAPAGLGAENRLDAMRLDATRDGLYIGLEGLFSWSTSATEVWLDVDPLATTGWPSLAGHLTDTEGVADRALSASRLAPPASPFGADFALIAVAGADPKLEELRDDGGLRALRPPAGQPHMLGWRVAAINYGAVRPREAPATPVPGQGLEAFVPWHAIYPGGIVPVGARVRLAAVMTSATGEFASNQLLPPLPPGAETPGTEPVPLPGVVEYVLDGNGDGQVDGDQPPIVLR